MDVIKQMYDIPAWCPASGNEYRRAARAAAHVGSCPCEQDRRGSCTGAAGGGLRWAPPLVFGLYAGVLSDRLDRRRIVIAADGIRAVVLSVLIATMIAGRVSVTVALLALGLSWCSTRTSGSASAPSGSACSPWFRQPAACSAPRSTDGSPGGGAWA